jgi:exopolysaccharide biosynthesis WecB/TagA/CpsF family protein
MKVLLIGHACSPRYGSEPSFTWNWAWHLSAQHEIYVLACPYDRHAVEAFLSDHPNSRLRFYWIPLPGSRGIRPVIGDTQSPWRYLLWQALAYERAAELHKSIRFDIVHHVSYGSVSAPPPVRKLGIPFVWGPIGGAQQAPAAFRRYFGQPWSREAVRSARVRLLRFWPSLRSAARASAITLATNQETASLLRQLGAQDVRLCLDSGIPSGIVSNRRAKPKNEELILFWAGRMQPRKALPLALEALAAAGENVRLRIAGDGEMRGPWEEYAKALHLEDRVEFLGRIPWDAMSSLYENADAFLFTSLRDSFGTQVLEAMGHGLPVLTVDHQGVGTLIPSNAAIKIAVTTPRETVKGIAEGIRWLARNPDARERLGEAARAYAQTQTWEKRASRMSGLYKEVRRRRTSPKLGGPAAYGSYGVQKRVNKIDETIDLKGMRVLDLGCGNGCYTAELMRRSANVLGVDLQMPHLKAFREAIPRLQAAGENLPFASESFDAVTMIEVLEHTECDSQVLNECFRVLKPGGFLVLFVPNKCYPFESHPCHIGEFSLGINIPMISWLPDSVRKRLCDARVYSRRKLISMARLAGFQTRGIGYIFPPLDSLRLPFKKVYRQLAFWLERSPLARFGVSIHAVFQKPAPLDANLSSAGQSFPIESASFETMGVRVHAVQMQEVVARMEQWIREGRGGHSIAATSMHGMVEAQHDFEFRRILNSTDLIVPDGTPLVWLGRSRGYPVPGRVYGPDLMLAFCEKAGRNYRHFFYGGEPGVAERLAESLKHRFPGMQTVGVYSPPFRHLNAEEDEEVVALISRAAPDVLWIGLGTPKQERWMFEHVHKLQVPVLASVGAAFDLLSGRRKQAPRWLRNHGLEWLFRLLQEPRRLWRRYLIYGPQFVAYLALELLRLKEFKVLRHWPSVSGRPGSKLAPEKDFTG